MVRVWKRSCFGFKHSKHPNILLKTPDLVAAIAAGKCPEHLIKNIRSYWHKHGRKFLNDLLKTLVFGIYKAVSCLQNLKCWKCWTAVTCLAALLPCHYASTIPYTSWHESQLKIMLNMSLDVYPHLKLFEQFPGFTVFPWHRVIG